MTKLFTNIVSILLLGLFLIGCEDEKCCELDKNKISSTDSKNIIKNNEENTLVDLSLIESNETNTEPLSIPIEPNAIAHIDGQRTVIKTTPCKLLDIDASSSYDPDGDNQKLSYIWTNINGYLLSTKKSFVEKYNKKGFDEITLRVTDEQNLTSIDRICVLAGIDESEIPLIVRVEGEHEVKAGEKTYLKGHGVCRNDIVKYEWREFGLLLSNKQILGVTFGEGEHNITLTIEDIEGNQATDYVIVNSI
jgi:hypothetical protein